LDLWVNVNTKEDSLKRVLDYCLLTYHCLSLKQLCPTRGPVEGFVRPSLGFRCSLSMAYTSALQQQWRNEGGQGGTPAPGRSTLRAPNWDRNVTY